MSRLTDTMARDMKIYPYTGEKQEYYYGRLVYSALAHWLRYATQDNQELSKGVKSKAYLLNRGKEVLSDLLIAIPEARDWFFRDIETIDEIVSDIRQKMLFSGEILECITPKEGIALPAYERIACNEGYDRILGLLQHEIGEEFIGVTRIVENKRNDFSRDSIDCVKYIEWLFDTAKWGVCSNIDDYEMFDPFSKKPPYQSWTEKKNKSIRYHLGRLTLFNGLHEYWLLKYMDGVWYCAALPEILSSAKEERRILLALREKSNNQMNAEYQYKGSIVLLRLFCKLPMREETTLNLYSWPLRNSMDRLDYVVPFKMWNCICSMLTDDLRIVLREKI